MKSIYSNGIYKRVWGILNTYICVYVCVYNEEFWPALNTLIPQKNIILPTTENWCLYIIRSHQQFQSLIYTFDLYLIYIYISSLIYFLFLFSASQSWVTRVRTRVYTSYIYNIQAYIFFFYIFSYFFIYFFLYTALSLPPTLHYIYIYIYIPLCFLMFRPRVTCLSSIIIHTRACVP